LDKEVRSLATAECFWVFWHDPYFASIDILDVELEIVYHQVVDENVCILLDLSFIRSVRYPRHAYLDESKQSAHGKQNLIVGKVVR
jgi:hypothetical protein